MAGKSRQSERDTRRTSGAARRVCSSCLSLLCDGWTCCHEGKSDSALFTTRSFFRNVCSPLFYVPLTAALLSLSAGATIAQTAPKTVTTPGLKEKADPNAAGQNILGINVGTNAPRPADERPGKAFAEVLRGNGTRAGYILSHGSIQMDTVSITAGGKNLRSGRDYWLDAANGSLIFSEPVSRFDSVSISYRYVEGKDAQRQAVALPGLQLNLSQNTQLGFMYGVSPGSGNGFTASTYGLSLNSKFGAGGSSAYSGLLYYSNVQKAENLVIPQAGDNGAPAPNVDTGSDHLITQNLNLQSSGVRLRADYQDIGKKFAGFQTLKMNNANNKSLIDQLTAMENEKGIKRLGFGLDFGFDPKGQKQQGLSLNWNSIQDETGAITQQALNYNSSAFRAFYNSRAVGKDFAAFKGLREAEKGQWALEKGMTSSGFGLGFNFGGGKKGSVPGALDFVSQKFSDESGSLNRNLWTLHNGGLSLSMLNRESDKGFGRMANLSAADKTALALDIYRQYDANAKPEQVTGADLAQVGREAGLKRDGLRADLALSKTSSVSYMQTSVADAPKSEDTPDRAKFRRDALALQTSNFEMSVINRKTDSSFARIADLADVEKGYLALDIRRQYDPAATLAQVTPKEREQAGRESGLSRMLLASSVKLGKDSGLTFRQFGITAEAPGGDASDANRSVQRQSFALTTKNLQLSLSNQSIGTGFTKITELNDVERSYLGNERGLRRDQLELNWKVNKGTRIGFSRLGVRGTAEAVSSAVASESSREGGDAEKAARQAGSGFQQQSFALDAKGVNLVANFADVDKLFARAMDLALPEPVRRQIEAERGFKRTDWTGKFAIGKMGLLDTYSYNSDNNEDQLGRSVYRHSLALKPTKRLSVNYNSDGDLSKANDKWNGTRHSLLVLNQELGNGLALRMEQDDTATYNNGEVVKGQKTDYKRFQTAQNKPNNLTYEMRNVEYHDGKFENMTNLNIHAKPSKKLSVSYNKLDIERGDEDPSESTSGYALELNATKNFSIVAGVSEKDVTKVENQDVKTITLGMQGQPTRDVTLSAKFDEVHQIGQNVKDVADISLSNSKPMTFGPFQDLTITARYAALNDKNKLQNETMTGRAAWKLWKNEFILDYGGYVMPNGSTVTRLYQFTTDPNPKKWFRGSFLYKARTLLDGQEYAVRRFTADAKMSKNTSFTYTFGALQEDERANIIPANSLDLNFKHTFKAGKEFNFYYRLSENAATKIMTRALGFGFEAQIDKMSKFGIGYSAEGNNWPDRYDRSNHFRISYERYLRADHYFNLSADFRSHDAPGLDDEILATVDFRFRF